MKRPRPRPRPRPSADRGHSTRRGRGSTHDERGAVLALTLVMLVVGSLVVGSLLTYSITVSKALPATRGRAARIELARAGVRMAIDLQREAGPASCFAASSTFRIGSTNVVVKCKPLESVSSIVDRFGVITTGNERTSGISGAGGGFVKPIEGEVFLNAGALAAASGEFSVASPVVLSAYSSSATVSTRFDTGCSGNAGCDTQRNERSRKDSDRDGTPDADDDDDGIDADHDGRDRDDLDADNDGDRDDDDDDDGKDSDGDGEDADGSDGDDDGDEDDEDDDDGKDSDGDGQDVDVKATVRDRDRDGERDSIDDDDGFDSDGDGTDTDGPAPVAADGLADCTTDTVIDTDQFARRKQANGSDTPKETTCAVTPWWNHAGDLKSDGSRAYPTLPPIPTYERSGSLASIAGCNVYYPGRYLGAAPLTLNGGKHYFASGVYYFERPLEIKGGATVVFGEGKERGCSFDADAAFAPAAGATHDINGKGAMIILGSGATLTTSGGAKLTVNRRMASATNGASGQQSIRTVSFGVSSPAVEVPADEVKLADGNLSPASSHQIAVGATTARYTASTLTPANTAVSVDVSGGGRFVLEGALFTPNSRVRVTSTNSSYTLQMAKGVVAAAVEMKLPAAPAAAATGFKFGSINEIIQRRFEVVATATTDGSTITSTAVIEVDINRRYAVNSWTVEQ